MPSRVSFVSDSFHASSLNMENRMATTNIKAARADTLAAGANVSFSPFFS